MFGMDSLTEIDWECLQLVEQLSQPITEATSLLSGDQYPTISLAIPIILAAKYVI